MSSGRFGGQPKLHVLAVGGPELTDCLVSVERGGKLDEGLQERVSQRYGVRFEIDLQTLPGGRLAELGVRLLNLERTPDVVVLSPLDDVLMEGPLDTNEFLSDSKRLCVMLKDMGVYVLIANIATFDPLDSVTNYSGLVVDTPSLRAHKVAAAIIDLSYQLGISVIDADRLLAEMGAAEHVESIGRYSAAACAAICAEVQRILEDYGFFEERPLILQTGRQASQ
jgi:hypothetical protein